MKWGQLSLDHSFSQPQWYLSSGMNYSNSSMNSPIFLLVVLSGSLKKFIPKSVAEKLLEFICM